MGDTDVQWFDNYPELWNEYCEGKDLKHLAEEVGSHLENKLGLSCTLSPEQSKFFKRHYNSDKHNQAICNRDGCNKKN
jgi:hypothetical protein